MGKFSDYGGFMVIEKGVCYGRTTEDVKKFSFPEDTESHLVFKNK